MRSLAPHVANPRTPAQVEQRTKLSVCVKTLRPWQEVLKVGYPGLNGEKGWSGAIRANLPQVQEAAGQLSLPFDATYFTNSTIGAQITVTFQEGKVLITWVRQSSPEIADNGQLLFAFKNEGEDIVRISYAEAINEELQVSNPAFDKKGEWVAFLFDSTNVTAAEKGTHTPAV